MSLPGVLSRQGAKVVFILTQPGSHDPTTDTSGAPVITKVRGHAMEINPDPKVYESLQLTQSENPTLLFYPLTAGEVPALNAEVEWGGEMYTVKDVTRKALNGTVTAARVVVSR